MAERVRVYQGVNELNVFDGSISETDDYFINSGSILIEANSNVTKGATIDFKKNDGSTSMFSGKASKISEELMWDVQVLTNGWELENLWIEQVYSDKTPEYIVEDIIDNYTSNLTYASTSVSGYTISGDYIAKGYAIDIIKDMMDALGWPLIIDVSDNVFFDPPGTIDNGVTFTNGSNIEITKWEQDQEQGMVNRFKVKSGFEQRLTEEAKVGNSTSFSLDHKPAGTFKAVVAGSEISPDDYSVDAEGQTVTFTSAQVNPTFTYYWNKPIIVDRQDDASIAAYGEVFREIDAPWLDSLATARKYTQALLDVYSEGLDRIEGKSPDVEKYMDVSVGEIVFIVDAIRSKPTKQYIVKKKTLNILSGEVKFEFGSREDLIDDWRREVKERIKKLERKTINDDDIAYARMFKHDLDVELTLTQTWKWNSPENSFLFDHPTLGFFADYDVEPDCSQNSNTGTWTGTNVDGAGSQYNSSGARLYCGNFNGSDTKITVTDAASIKNIFDGGGTIFIAINPDTATNGEIINKGSWRLYLSDESGGACKIGFDQLATGTETWTSTAREITIGSWQYISLTYDAGNIGTNVPTIKVNNTTITLTKDSVGSGTRTTDVGTDLLIGNKSTEYYDGKIDEARLYDVVVADAVLTDLNAKILNQSDCVLYYAMDTPVLGDQSTAKQVIT